MPPDSPEQGQDARALLAEALWSDPETRPELERIIKKKFPHAPIPTFEARQEGERVLTEVRKERDEFKRETAAERERTALAAARREIMEDPELHIQAGEMAAIEKLMQDEYIGTHKAAARLYRAQQQIAAPRAESGGPMQVPGIRGAGGNEFKGIIENPDQWARDKAQEVMTEFRRGTR